MVTDDSDATQGEFPRGPVGEDKPGDQEAPDPARLKRLLLPLDNVGGDLLLVGDFFEEGGRYVQVEIKRAESGEWSWLDWDDAYDRLAREWHGRFLPADEPLSRGPVATALRIDLARFAGMDMGARRTLATLALRMAQAIDGWEEDRSSSGLSALARAHQELRATLEKLTETVVTDDDDDEFLARMSSAVRDSAQPGAADVRNGDGRGGGAPG